MGILGWFPSVFVKKKKIPKEMKFLEEKYVHENIRFNVISMWKERKFILGIVA